MSARDDLAGLVSEVFIANSAHPRYPEQIADAILAAGWVSPEVHQEALDAMALQVTYTEDGTWEVLRRFRETRAALQRVREALDASYPYTNVTDIREALDGKSPTMRDRYTNTEADAGAYERAHYDPEPDYDRPTRQEAEADERDDA